jgi:hypothetical protein
MSKSEILNIVKLALVFLLPLPLLVIPPSSLERLPSLCLIKSIFGVECPGCGMTRALSYLLHGDLPGGLHSNPLALIVLPLLGFLWLRFVVINTLSLFSPPAR